MRPTVAKWLRDTSLGTKLSSFIALIVVGGGDERGVPGSAVVRAAHRRGLDGLRPPGRAIGRGQRRPAAVAVRPAAIFGTRCTIWWPPIRCSMRSRSSSRTTPAALRVVTSTSTEERAEVVDLGGPRHRRQGADHRAHQHGDHGRAAGPAPRELRGGRHRRPGEPAPDTDPRAARRARVRRCRPSCSSRSSSTSRSGSSSDSRFAPSCATMHETQEGNLRARATLDRHDELGAIAERPERDARSARTVQPVAAGPHRGSDARPVAAECRNWLPARASCSR